MPDKLVFFGDNGIALVTLPTNNHVDIEKLPTLVPQKRALSSKENETPFFPTF